MGARETVCRRLFCCAVNALRYLRIQPQPRLHIPVTPSFLLVYFLSWFVVAICVFNWIMALILLGRTCQGTRWLVKSRTPSFSLLPLHGYLYFSMVVCPPPPHPKPPILEWQNCLATVMLLFGMGLFTENDIEMDIFQPCILKGWSRPFVGALSHLPARQLFLHCAFTVHWGRCVNIAATGAFPT